MTVRFAGVPEEIEVLDEDKLACYSSSSEDVSDGSEKQEQRRPSTIWETMDRNRSIKYVEPVEALALRSR